MRKNQLFNLLALLVLASMVLSACGGAAPAATEAPSGAKVTSSGYECPAAQFPMDGVTSKEINIFVWTEYIPADMIECFELVTGIKVNRDEYSSNEEMYAKVSAGGTAYDLVQPTDYIVPLMARQGLLAELDKAKLPAFKNFDPNYLKHIDGAVETITITRGNIPIESVYSEPNLEIIPGESGKKLVDRDGKDVTDIGYIAISQFHDRTVQELRTQLQGIENKGYKGLILDLRSNPGGLLQATVDVADEAGSGAEDEGGLLGAVLPGGEGAEGGAGRGRNADEAACGAVEREAVPGDQDGVRRGRRDDVAGVGVRQALRDRSG